ncbi:hypothetical protein WA158_002459 [Blastocystis sp. Blastoise]
MIVRSEEDSKAEIVRLRRILGTLDQEIKNKNMKIKTLEDEIQQLKTNQNKNSGRVDDCSKTNEILRNKMTIIQKQAVSLQEKLSETNHFYNDCRSSLEEQNMKLKNLQNVNQCEQSNSKETEDKDTANKDDKNLYVDPRWEFAQMMYKEDLYQKSYKFDAETEAENGPKDISIFCSSNPQVRITDLPLDLVSKNICLQLQVGSPEIKSRLLLLCDGELSTENENSHE